MRGLEADYTQLQVRARGRRDVDVEELVPVRSQTPKKMGTDPRVTAAVEAAGADLKDALSSREAFDEVEAELKQEETELLAEIARASGEMQRNEALALDGNSNAEAAYDLSRRQLEIAQEQYRLNGEARRSLREMKTDPAFAPDRGETGQTILGERIKAFRDGIAARTSQRPQVELPPESLATRPDPRGVARTTPSEVAEPSAPQGEQVDAARGDAARSEASEKVRLNQLRFYAGEPEDAVAESAPEPQVSDTPAEAEPAPEGETAEAAPAEAKRGNRRIRTQAQRLMQSLGQRLPGSELRARSKGRRAALAEEQSQDLETRASESQEGVESATPPGAAMGVQQGQATRTSLRERLKAKRESEKRRKAADQNKPTQEEAEDVTSSRDRLFNNIMGIS